MRKFKLILAANFNAFHLQCKELTVYFTLVLKIPPKNCKTLQLLKENYICTVVDNNNF